MEEQKNRFLQGLTFDDVLLRPGYTDFARSDISLATKLTAKITLEIPFVSSPMDTVTESDLALSIAKMGGIGIVHRNLSVVDQVAEVEKVKAENLLVGAAVGASSGFEERVDALVKAQTDVFVLDAAHGYTKTLIDALLWMKKKYPQIQVIAGNIATGEAAQGLIENGADALRVGMGPGAICTTRVISGMGVPQITALLDVCSKAAKKNIPVIADGGLKNSGDMVKALAAGASALMMGSFFAASLESPGKVFALSRGQVPHRFQSIFTKEQKQLPGIENMKNAVAVIPGEEGVVVDDTDVFYFKEYRGMGSEGAMKKGADVKSEDEYHGKSYKDRVLVAEGVEGMVPIKGTVKDLLDQAIGGVKSGMFYVGAKSIEELWQKAQFLQITQASLQESHPHSILVTNAGKNYS